VKRRRPAYRWSDPAIVAANQQGSLHPSQLAAFTNRRIWFVFPLVLLFIMLPCGACAWFGCNASTDPFDPSGDGSTHWVCGNPIDIGNLPRWTLMAVGLMLALGAAYALLRYDRRYRARVLSGPIRQSPGWVTFQATGPVMARRYVVSTNGLRLKSLAGREDLPPPGAYTFFYEATTRLLLSAEPLRMPAVEGSPWSRSASPSTVQLIQQALAAGFPFTPDDLDSNRAGALSDAQRRVGRVQLMAQAIGSLIFLLFVLAVAITMGTFGLDGWRVGAVSLADLVRVTIAGVLLVALGRIAWQARTRLSSQTVAVYEGPVERLRVGGGESPTRHYFRCGPRRLTVSGGAYNALVADYIYRVYYSPRLQRALSAEVLGQSQTPYYGRSDEASGYETS
jgi:hypothetical protein